MHRATAAPVLLPAPCAARRPNCTSTAAAAGAASCHASRWHAPLPGAATRSTCPYAAASHSSRCTRTRCRAASGDGDFPAGDPFLNLFKSSVFRNSLVVQEFNTVVNELMGLSKLSSNFPKFDIEGKRMYLDKVKDASGRYEVFMKRLELSEDPAAREFLRIQQAQMLNGGFTLRGMFDGLRGSLAAYERWVSAEEAALAAGPAKHMQFQQEMASAWSQSAMGAIDMGALAKSVSPEVMMQAQNDPMFWAAIKEISENPSTAVISKWMERDSMRPLLVEIARVMFQKQAGL